MKRAFIINAFLLGIGLAMDAFTVSIANGLEDPKMKNSRMILIAGTFGLFQTAMPLLGWIFVHYLREKFILFEKAVPYIALLLLLYIGGKMIYAYFKHEETEENLGMEDILIQGIATSIDALSVGFTISSLSFSMALYEAMVIGVVTFVICLFGVAIGKAGGSRFSKKAPLFGSIILIAVGIEIFITGVM